MIHRHSVHRQWPLIVAAAGCFFTARVAAEPSQPETNAARIQSSRESEARERQLLDSVLSLEGEVKRLNGDLDAFIDKAAASQKADPATPPPAQKSAPN